MNAPSSRSWLDGPTALGYVLPRLTAQSISNELGLSRETVFRVLRQLRADRLIIKTGGGSYWLDDDVVKLFARVPVETSS